MNQPQGRPLWGSFSAIAAVVVAADQVAKAWVVQAVPADGSLSIVGDLVRLIVTHNTGAIFGLFRDQAGLFAIASIGVLGLIAVYHARSGRSPFLTLTLGLLLGGALGNFVDRIRLGYVIDFVDAGIGDLRFYTFNVADAAISGALLLLLLLAVRPHLGMPRPIGDERA
ncbi:MAG: signal peptidase II [Chloroflexota bacterium]